MHRFANPVCLLAITLLGCLAMSGIVLAADDLPKAVSYEEPKGPIQQVQQLETPAQPTGAPGAAPSVAPPTVPELPPLPPIGGGTTPPPSAGTAGTAVPADYVPVGNAALGLASSDVGNFLIKSPSATGVETQFRSPAVSDPRIRGYHVGQITTIFDWGYFFPVRQDLDTAVSKINSSVVQDIIVVKGPYTVRYGPGFAFLDVMSRETPRYENGFEAHGLTSLLYKTNGSQWRGRQSFWGGDNDYGFRIGYDLMTGDDYADAHGNRVPSGYNSQNIDVAFGFDLNESNHFEIKVLRQDQENVQLPGQAFDLTNAITDAYSIRYVLDHMDYFTRLTAEAWYNESRFNGNNFRPAKQFELFSQLFAMPNQSFSFLGVTNGNSELPGYRTYITWGDDKCPQLTIGSDLRYITQRLDEFDTIIGVTGDNPIPRSHQVDPGVFIDGVLPLLDNRLLLKAGFRADWAGTDIDSLPVGVDLDKTIGPGPYNREFNLWSSYLTSEFKLTDHWTATSGFGTALRPPTLTELYASGPFMGVIQNGLNIVHGNPFMTPEEARQLDLGLRAQYDSFHFGLNGFYSWIHNYITFLEEGQVFSGGPFNQVRFINTNRASLSGFEMYADWDMYEWLTPFVVMSYVEGRDYSRDNRPTIDPTKVFSGPQEPLPGIPPLDTRLGLRVHDSRKPQRWGVEGTVRIVSPQNRIAQSLGEVATPGFTVVTLRCYWQVNKNLLLTSGVENLTNTFYREHLDLRAPFGVTPFEPGVNFYFAAQLTY
jgi:outer membrane receptor protein involved in Fe transport